MTHTGNDPMQDLDHSLMYDYDKALGKAEKSLRNYIMVSGSANANAKRLHGTLLSTSTDWIHKSYRDLTDIPFSNLINKGDITEIQRRVGGQFKEYYNTDNLNSYIISLPPYMRDIDMYRNALKGEDPEKNVKKEWEDSCKAVDELRKALESLNTNLNELGALIKEILRMIKDKDCAGDPNCLRGTISEWNRVMKYANNIDRPEET